MNGPVGYVLQGVHFYVRGETASRALRRLARKVNEYEADGWTTEAVSVYPTGDDWVGVVLMQHWLKESDE